MRIELRAWHGNTEVMLLEDDGLLVDRFYTADSPELPCNVDAVEQFRIMEDKLTPPKIGGQFAQFHPYWAERKAKRSLRQ